nr:MAG TPA: hypothetical protein [Caudoviricetes sp.]
MGLRAYTFHCVNCTLLLCESVQVCVSKVYILA